MPKYVFVCEKCQNSKTSFASYKTTYINCECGSQMNRQMPNIAQQQVNETIDTYTNTKRDQNHVENIKTRNDDHYWNVEVERLIQTYSTETCIENGWLVYNEKGELVKGKAPHKR